MTVLVRLAWTTLTTIVFQLIFFAVAYWHQIDKVTDLSAAINFAVLALLGLVVNATYLSRQIAVTFLTTIWSARLGSFLLIRVLIRGKDNRFDHIRQHFWRFLSFWIIQMVWIVTVSLPVTLTNAVRHDSPLTTSDLFGWLLAAVGLILETVADLQKLRHHLSRSEQHLSSGVWSVSRHPNYFGEIAFWFGMFFSSFDAYRYQPNALTYRCLSFLSPILTAILLLFVSGIPLAEKKSTQLHGNSESYLAYKASTSPLLPFPPTLYKRLPLSVKKWFFFDFQPLSMPL